MVVIGAASLAVVVAPAWGHQIASNNGVSVQVHVNPNDEPMALTDDDLGRPGQAAEEDDGLRGRPAAAG